MRKIRIQTAAVLLVIAPLVACAAGSVTSDVGPGPLTEQSDATDSGAQLDDSALPSPTPLPPTTTNDSGGPPPSDDAGAPQPSPIEGANVPPSEDAGAPPPVEDSAPPSPPPPSDDSGTSTASCPGYALPATPAACTCSAYPGVTCAANNCYNGYYCELSDLKCVKKPAGC